MITLALLLINRFAIVSTGWKMSNSATPAMHSVVTSMCHSGRRVGVPEAPDPRTRAVPESEPLDDGRGDIFGQEELQVADKARSVVTWRRVFA